MSGERSRAMRYRMEATRGQLEEKELYSAIKQ